MLDKTKIQEIFTEAEALWSKISDMAQAELTGIVEGSGHDILIDIARGRVISWEDDLKSLAKMLHHQGEVVVTLDVLRQAKKGDGNGDS